MTGVYPASRIKRNRATNAEVENRRRELFDIVQEMYPMSVRGVYYQATVRSLVEKTEGGYDKVQHDLVLMRRAGDLPYGWITDNTRWQRKPRTFGSIDEALDDTLRLYRKSLWADADCYVEIWLEKDALAGVILPVTSEYDVPLMVARGYASLSFLYEAAEYINELDVPTFIYHLGDYDPSGVNAGETIERSLRELAPNAAITFKRLAVTPQQIARWNLPTRPTKPTDSRSKGFGDISVELDAIDPNTLRDIVRHAIEQHLPADQLAVLQVAEASERELLTTLVADVKLLAAVFWWRRDGPKDGTLFVPARFNGTGRAHVGRRGRNVGARTLVGSTSRRANPPASCRPPTVANDARRLGGVVYTSHSHVPDQTSASAS